MFARIYKKWDPFDADVSNKETIRMLICLKTGPQDADVSTKWGPYDADLFTKGLGIHKRDFPPTYFLKQMFLASQYSSTYMLYTYM